MDKVLLVGGGGFIGSVLRFGIGALIVRLGASPGFPLATLLINGFGCLVLGFLAEFGEARGLLSEPARAFLFIGLLGGFTTFSTFGYETFQLLRQGRWDAAGLSAALQFLIGIGGVWAGASFARWGS